MNKVALVLPAMTSVIRLEINQGGNWKLEKYKMPCFR
jgi:hypothetical protein